MTKLTPEGWEERNRLLGRILEEIAGITEIELLNELLVAAKRQKGRAIGHAIKAKKAATTGWLDIEPNP